MEIPLFCPTIKRRDMNSVLSCMVSDSIGPGALNHELASSVSQYLGVAGGFCLSNYSAAIQCALDALDLQQQDSVVISALAPSLYLKFFKIKGLVPLIADVDQNSGVLLLPEIEKFLSSNPKAIILHYTLGYIPDIENILQLGIPILEDISQALGGIAEERCCGSLGDIIVLSMEPDGIMTSAGGGLVLARERRMFRDIKKILERYPANLFLPDINAALGLSQLKEIDKFLLKRRELAEIFTQSLMKSRHQTLIQPGEKENTSFSFPVIVEDSMKQIRQYAMKNNIQTLPAFSDSIITFEENPAVGEDFRPLKNSCPEAENLLRRCLQFPLYPSLGKKNVQLISKVLTTLP